MTILKTLAACAVLMLASPAVQANDVSKGDISVSNPWTRATPPNARAAGGFVTISNTGSGDDRLTAVASPLSDRVEIHEMAVNDGVMKMRQLADGLIIPAGETVTLEPGGLHIMFLGINGRFEQGTTVPVTLRFEQAGDISIKLPVAAMGSKTMDHGKMGHDKMDHSGHGKN